MIRICYEPGVRRLTADGHAGYAPRGQDIVCAAVSALLFALIGDLQQRPNALRQLDIQPGHVVIAGGEEDCLASFSLTVEGLRQIAMRYPAFVAVTIKGS